MIRLFIICLCRHNDFVWKLRLAVDNALSEIDLRSDLTQIIPLSNTDIPRMRRGMIGAQVGYTVDVNFDLIYTLNN